MLFDSWILDRPFDVVHWTTGDLNRMAEAVWFRLAGLSPGTKFGILVAPTAKPPCKNMDDLLFFGLTRLSQGGANIRSVGQFAGLAIRHATCRQLN